MSGSDAITPKLFESALRNWDELAYLAYDGFTSAGHGLIALEQVSESHGPMGVRASYVRFPDGRPSEETARVIAAYDPMLEFVVMYREPAGTVRTRRVRTAPDGRNPKRVWFFETLRRLNEEPDNAPKVIPEWFWEFLEKVAAKNREHDA